MPSDRARLKMLLSEVDSDGNGTLDMEEFCELMFKQWKKQPEPGRNKTHWDYLLQEMEWLSKDFREERQWKVALARKAVKAVTRWHQEREASGAKGPKSMEFQQKKLAAAISREVLELFRGLDLEIFEGYGQSETTAIVTFNRAGAVRLGSVGRALPGVLLRIAEDGEILAQGKNIFAGYLGLLLLSSATAAIGIFGSSLFRSQLAAAVIAGVLVVTLLTAWLVSAITDPPFAAVLAHAALFDKHFVPFMEGSIPTTAIVYYATVTGVFLLMSTRVLDGRRWE